MYGINPHPWVVSMKRTSRWSVALRTFYRQILSLTYRCFFLETSAPGLPGSTCSSLPTCALISMILCVSYSSISFFKVAVPCLLVPCHTATTREEIAPPTMSAASIFFKLSRYSQAALEFISTLIFWIMRCFCVGKTSLFKLACVVNSLQELEESKKRVEAPT